MECFLQIYSLTSVDKVTYMFINFKRWNKYVYDALMIKWKDDDQVNVTCLEISWGNVLPHWRWGRPVGNQWCSHSGLNMIRKMTIIIIFISISFFLTKLYLLLFWLHFLLPDFYQTCISCINFFTSLILSGNHVSNFCGILRTVLGTPSKKQYGIIWEFFPTWGGGSSQFPKLLLS